jgi:uncharacterized protein (DUF697 family)
MTRKPLPKAITRPLGNLRGFDPSAAAPNEAAARSAAVPFDKVEAESALAVSSAPIANDVAAPAQEVSQKLAARRRALARKIVSRHKNYAAMGGLVPLPVVNIAGITAINLRMVKQLSELYQVPFERDRTRSLIVGLIGGAVPTGVGTATSSTLMWIVPGGMLLGLSAAALTAGALTRGIGLVFIESLESAAEANYATASAP